MYVMKSFVKEREKELKVTPNSKVDNLFHEVKTFFFEINKLNRLSLIEICAKLCIKCLLRRAYIIRIWLC